MERPKRRILNHRAPTLLTGENKMPALFGTLFFITMVAAWFTHILTCLSDGSWGFLIAGALMFPIAIIHGFGIWIGVF